MIVVEPHPEGATFFVRARPGSRKNEIRGEHDGALKVSVTQVAEKGKANEAVVDVLCEALDLRKGQIVLLSGETDRRKRFLVRDVTVDQLCARLESRL
jgi:uncharacterized protein YggU (UPF0235/DUF167 family)